MIGKRLAQLRLGQRVLMIGDDDETHSGTELQLALAELSESNLLDAEIRTEKVPGLDRDAVEILVVNTSPEEVKGLDTRLYEVGLAVRIENYEPFLG